MYYMYMYMYVYVLLTYFTNIFSVQRIFYFQNMTKLVSQETKISSNLSQENSANQTDNCTNEPNNIPQYSRSPSSSTKFKSYKIIVLGESGVGKTCLSFRFCAGRFPMHTEATIGLDFREKVGCGGETLLDSG